MKDLDEETKAKLQEMMETDKAIEKVLTMDELVGEFAREHEEDLK